MSKEASFHPRCHGHDLCVMARDLQSRFLVSPGLAEQYILYSSESPRISMDSVSTVRSSDHSVIVPLPKLHDIHLSGISAEPQS